MKKIIFCNIAYMKDYCGAYDDTPVNGGKYIEENNDGGETYNFLDYNGKCYGYFMHYGDIRVERIDNNASKQNYVEDVLVIWVAKKSNGKNVIVGWYKNATVYKYAKCDFTTSTFGYYPEPARNLSYDIVADAADCFLLPEDERDFKIPRASVEGTGRGMGQSAIWYADSDYAKKEFIPKVIEYIRNCEENDGEFINKVWTTQMLEKSYQGDKSEDELVGLAQSQDTSPETALEYINAVLKMNESTDNIWVKADILTELFRFNEAIPYYERVFENCTDNLDAAQSLFLMYMITQQYDKAIVTAQLMEQNAEFGSYYDDENRANFYYNIIMCYAQLNKAEKADKYRNKLKEIDNDTAKECLEAVDDNLDLH